MSQGFRQLLDLPLPSLCVDCMNSRMTAVICVCVVRRGFMCVFKHVVIPVTVSLDCTCNTLLVLSFWIKIRFNTSYSNLRGGY